MIQWFLTGTLKLPMGIISSKWTLTCMPTTFNFKHKFPFPGLLQGVVRSQASFFPFRQRLRLNYRQE